jgi:hypothetical protein
MGLQALHPAIRRSAFARNPIWSAMASVYLLGHAHRALHHRERSVGLVVVPVLRWELNGLRVVCSGVLPVHGSALIRHATSKAVSAFSGHSVAFFFLCLHIQLTQDSGSCRWWVRIASDALYTNWPGLYGASRCCGRSLYCW